ncbi:ribosomal RNA-processing protein 8 [Myripristis murdjan]|uniref:Ribosomal RNA-processing protein 8 n=1 Tax=Myripristis murdjan TaxID=586833 RepID=A0A667X3R2_9TELE|nr:ribosomal RNA-processing protein 8 [Myripristis murdjan]XP_029922728.1 ribosomal RNA-processing protein 8 [Myripristis murdjan]XP_029922729.1 ribosomal RNA-processing protein 8 [Myripristis murdjan]XP_029922730.1 ribosomal RNA-processing protein 8 [Myripristis murdjan]
MFIEDEDWSDEPEAEALTKTVFSSAQKASNSSVTIKGVGKKSLLRTLQTLGSVPDWRSDAPPRDSDSEAEAEAVPSSHTKKKKKRRKRQKQVEISAEEAQNGDLDVESKEEKTVTQKKKKANKSGAQKVKNKDKTEAGETPTSASVEGEETQRLSRKQWKNKMKNKRKCKNKYRHEEPEGEVNQAETARKQSQKDQQSADSNSNGINSEPQARQAPALSNKKEKGRKPQKRKLVEVCDTSATLDKETLREVKQPVTKENKTKGDQHVSKKSDGAKEEAGEARQGTSDEQQQQQHPEPGKKLRLEVSKEQSRKKAKLRRLLHSQEPNKQEAGANQKDEVREIPKEEEVQEASAADRSSSLRSRMEQRLEAARFRYINEVLYTTTSREARRMFTQDPQAFWVYHKGYTAQVQRWPANPVDAIISYIRQKPVTQVVADFGCGDCKIARSVKNKVHCFDLAPTCDLVTVCDMANVPLDDGTVHIAVFCLSLMGTNLTDFLVEANRVLVMGGVLKVAEVASRFDNVRSFLTALASLGFKMVSKDTENSHFYAFEFVKTGNAPENVKKAGLQLRPCVYKKR